MDVKEQDLFWINYNESYKKSSDREDEYLIAILYQDGNFYLQSTDYTLGDITFSVDDALSCGELVHVSNMKELESIRDRERHYYKSEDVIDLSPRLANFKEVYVKVGAEKCADKMRSFLECEVNRIQRELEWNQHCLKITKEKLEEVKKGNLDIML